MIEKVTTSGIRSLDGQDFEVENNIWTIGDAEWEPSGMHCCCASTTSYLGSETETLAIPRGHDVDEQMVIDLRRMLKGAGTTPQ